MASSLDFIEYVCDQIAGTGMVTFRKMFGEYMVYVNAKPILLICNNTVYIKMQDCIRDVMKNADTDAPYNGAKLHYILDIDNAELSRQVIRILEPITSIPKPRKKK